MTYQSALTCRKSRVIIELIDRKLRVEPDGCSRIKCRNLNIQNRTEMMS